MPPSFRGPRLSSLALCMTPPAENGLCPRKIWSISAAYEPSLSELMADPIFGHLLTSDGVERDHVETLITEMRCKLGSV